MEDAPGLRNIRQIINAAGGATAISKASDGTIKADAVYKWPHIGIPDRHWPIVMPLAGATADEMLAANVAVRTESAA